jgi:hypothetical protein
MRETRVVATKIVDELDLSIYQPAYDKDNRCVKPLVLTTPRCKSNSASDVSSSFIISQDGPFEKLTEIQWKARDPPTSANEA